MQIITITPSPAIDLHLAADALCIGEYNPAAVIRADSAGKGINLSRALHRSGIDSLAVVFVGAEGAEGYLAPLKEQGMRLLPILTEGAVRENINIQTGERETVIATSGPAVQRKHIEEAEARVLPLINRDTFVVLSGSISDGSDKDRLIEMLIKMRDKGARLIVDTRSLTLEEIVALRPHLIKPNEAEAEALTGLSVRNVAEGVRAAVAIRDMGVSRVLLTLGSKGAVFAVESGIYTTPSPKVEVVSTVGAGDSTIAGYLASLTLGESAKGSLVRAVAFGSAACMEEGTAPPRPEVITALISSLYSSPLDAEPRI